MTKTQGAEMLAQLKGSVFGVDFSLFFFSPFSLFFVVVVSVVRSEAERLLLSREYDQSPL